MSFLVTGLCFLPALWKFHLLDLPPIAWAVVVKGMDDPVVVLDPGRRIVELNVAAERLTGLRSVEAAGAGAASAFASWPELADRLGRIEGREESFVLDGPGSSPSPRVYDAKISPLSQAGRPCGWVLALRDVTQLKRAEEDRARMLGEQAANRAKDRLIAMLSHELRTPLTPILATVSAMREDPSTPEAFRDVLEMIHRNVALEARLIDDLLDQTWARRGQLRREREVVDVHELIGHVVEIFREDVREARLRLDLDLAAEKHRLFADPARMQQVLWNLVKNAIKFTPPGGRVAIETRNAGASPDEGGREALVVRVRDTGEGIAPDVLPHLFDGFDRPLAPETSGAGLGLGLAISRAVAELHGGRLFAESEGKGRGATFTIEMPDALAPEPEPEPEPADAPARIEHEAEASGRPLTILLVEDNVDTLEFLSRLLREKGHDVLPAARLDSALRLAAGREFDVLVSDIELPDGNGHELMWRLRAQGTTPGIALSGFGTADDVEMSLSAGFAEHLTKPVDFRRLMDAVDRVTARAVDQLVER
jgi:PAS domain S-box-containing protein